MLPEVVRSRPGFGLILARADIAPVYRRIVLENPVYASFVPIEIIIGTETFGCLGTACNIAFERLIMPCLVFSELGVCLEIEARAVETSEVVSG
jgi:hypothetical protein